MPGPLFHPGKEGGGSLKERDSWKAGHSHAVPGRQVPVDEPLGTQILHAAGDVCHELHQHLSGQELGGQGRREMRSAEAPRSIPPLYLPPFPCGPSSAQQWFPVALRMKSNPFTTWRHVTIASCLPLCLDLLQFLPSTYAPTGSSLSGLKTSHACAHSLSLCPRCALCQDCFLPDLPTSHQLTPPSRSPPP